MAPFGLVLLCVGILMCTASGYDFQSAKNYVSSLVEKTTNLIRNQRHADSLETLAASFICEEDGLYANPSECSTYVRCTDGEYSIHSCTEGQHFNNKTRDCEEPCEAHCDKIIACDCGWDSCEHNRRRPFLPQKQSQASISEFVCHENGKYPNPEDCKSYIDCLHGQKSVHMCPLGRHFSKDTQTCEAQCEAYCDPDIADMCGWGSKHENYKRPEYDFICYHYEDGHRFKSPHLDCYSYLECKGGMSYVFPCDEGLHFSEDKNICEDPCQAKCALALASKCGWDTTLEAPEGSEESNSGYEMKSPMESSGIVYGFTCIKDGMYKNPKNCSSFIQCSGGHSYVMPCSEGLHFNEHTQICELPCKAHCDMKMGCHCGWSDCDYSDEACGANERYSDCVNPCNDCETKGNCQFLICNEGCDCIPGHYRNEKGKCIPEASCPNIVCPIIDCRRGYYLDKSYKPCGKCVPEPEPTECPIIDCAKGYYLDKTYEPCGKCVPDPKACGPNERYSNCVNPCNDCEKKGNCHIVVCNKGCDCISGYHRSEKGRCIPEAYCRNETCGPNERYSECVVPCNDCERRGNCDFLVCDKGCDCILGFYRSEKGRCIAEATCPYKITCGRHSKFTNCASACPPTCSNPNPICAAVCVKGCVCEPGFMKDEHENCIPKEDCPAVACGLNSIPSDCASPCPPTCDNRYPTCNELCGSGCVCEHGYIKDSYGNCIPENECPTVTCGPNSIPTDCASTCPPTCDDRYPTCNDDCNSGCVCEHGYILDSYGNCIPENECPTETCGHNSKPSDCAAPCPPTCDDRNPICNEDCVKGCVCNYGYIKDNYGNCIPEDHCPAVTCGRNSKPSHCASPCPPTCSNRHPTCADVCVNGCVCDHGYIKDDYGNCIPADHCPAEIDCEAGPEVGPCKARIPRFYYDVYSGRCRAFYYGGCGGNSNNFELLPDCKKKCQEKMLGGFKCPSYTGKFGHYPDCKSYYDCKRGVPTLKRCPKGTAFDHKKSKCVIEYKAICVYECRDRDAVYPYEEDCHKYIDCVNGVAKLEKCPPGKAFSPHYSNCVDERHVSSCLWDS